MRWNCLTLLGIVVTAAACSQASSLSHLNPGGSIVGNGGDIITCTSSGESPFSGDYTLDYFATFDPRKGTSDDPTGSYDELLDRVARLVHAKLPELAPSLDAYLALAESRDESQVRIWRGLTASPTDLKDEDIRGLISENCKESRDGIKVPNLKQMVDRRYKIDSDVPKVYYYYDYDKFQELKNERPLQAAYLMIHEWIWDFSDSAWVSRSVNRLLQSKSTEQMTSDAVRRSVRAYGITGDEGGYIGVPTGRTAKLQQIFSQNPACDFSHRTVHEFFPESGREVFAAGEQRTFNLTVPADVTQTLGQKICGVALAFGYKGRLDLNLQRGVGVYHASYSGGSTATEALLSATCNEIDCLHRSGELADLYQPRGIAGSRWSIQLASNGGEAEMIVPYLLLVKMRE